MSQANSADADKAQSPSPSVSRDGLRVDRRPVPGRCPRCGASDVCTYPIHTEGGWFVATKCQTCLKTISREIGPRLGPIQLLSDSI
jgi:hypothetical protein